MSQPRYPRQKFNPRSVKDWLSGSVGRRYQQDLNQYDLDMATFLSKQSAMKGGNARIIEGRGPIFDSGPVVHEETRLNLQDSEMNVFVINGSNTPGAGMNYRATELENLASTYESWQTSDDAKKVRCNFFKEHIVLKSTSQFEACYFLTISEPGTSFTYQQGAASGGVNYRSVVEAGFGATEVKVRPLGAIVESRLMGDGSTYQAEFKLNLTPVVQKFLELAEKAVFNQDPLPEVKLILLNMSPDQNVAVTVTGFRKQFTYSVNR